MIEHTHDLSIRHAQIEIEMSTRKMRVAWNMNDDAFDTEYLSAAAFEMRKTIDAELLERLND